MSRSVSVGGGTVSDYYRLLLVLLASTFLWNTLCGLRRHCCGLEYLLCSISYGTGIVVVVVGWRGCGSLDLVYDYLGLSGPLHEY